MFSVNLMTCMTSLGNIARLRSDFMERVILGFETLHGKLWNTYYYVF